MPLPFRQRIFVILVALTAVPTALAVVAGPLSLHLPRPTDELVGWTRLIRRRMPLPAGPPTRGAPEFEALRQALRELATALDAARERELEAERLRAFREVARRVAHEIKNPLTAMRIAVDQLRRSGGPVERRTDVAVEGIGAETERLDQLARSEEHTSELQSRLHLVCRLLLEKKKQQKHKPLS